MLSSKAIVNVLLAALANTADWVGKVERKTDPAELGCFAADPFPKTGNQRRIIGVFVSLGGCDYAAEAVRDRNGVIAKIEIVDPEKPTKPL